jgi:hypothetical protein
MMMLNDTFLETLTTHTSSQALSQPVLTRMFFFHDVQVNCQSNHPAILAILEEMLDVFPKPDVIRGEVTYAVLCYDNIEQFPQPLPRHRVRTETMKLLTGTKLKYYRSRVAATRYYYQSYTPLSPVNEAALSVIIPLQGVACTQLLTPEYYQEHFLRRYVFLLALGQLMQKYGYEPCHASAITAPWDCKQGALIVGESGSGKTTLSVGCAATGFGLLGDDLVMLRNSGASGAIHAHTISHEVSMRSGSLTLWPALAHLQGLAVDKRDKRYCPIDEVRADAARFETPIRLLLFPALTDEMESVVTPLSKANVLQELVDQCLGKQRTMPAEGEEQLFLLLSHLAEQAPGFRLSIARGANDGPELVRSLFKNHTSGASSTSGNTAGERYE